MFQVNEGRTADAKVVHAKAHAFGFQRHHFGDAVVTRSAPVGSQIGRRMSFLTPEATSINIINVVQKHLPRKVSP